MATVLLMCFSMLILILACIIDFVSDKKKRFPISIFLASIAGVLMMTAVAIGTPSAMDVYRGKTTLEITYKDGIPVDSVVVFKNN